MSCLFCKFASKELPCHIVWEDEQFLAFLTIFPNTDGVTVVIPKQHYSSYLFDQDEKIMNELMSAAKVVAKKIDRAFPDVSRTGVIFEGFGVDHLHAKLYPMHGTGDLTEWKMIESSIPDKFFDRYEGYLSSHDCKQADDKKLQEIAEKIKAA